MKRSFKKMVSLIIVSAIIFGAAPLSGFKGIGSSLWNGLCSLAVSAKEEIKDIVERSAPEEVTDDYDNTVSQDYEIVEHETTENISDNSITTGKCGDNVYWTRKDDSLTITGTGDMYNYYNSYYNRSPFYNKSIKSVVIEAGVTSIGDELFRECTGLTSITIPDSVTSIGGYAFYNCSSLTNIEIPDSVTSIGGGAFSGTGLISVIIPDSVTSIGVGAFYGCTGLTSIEIPDSVTSIGNYAFNGCTSLTNVHITDIDAWAQIDFSNETANPLYYAKKLYLNNCLVEDFVLSENVTKIGTYAFANCESIISIEIPDSVTSIGGSAFNNCSSLTSITIPFVGATKNGDSNTHFGYIFGAYSYSDNNSYVPSTLKTVVISGGETIGSYAFYNCRSLTSIEIPDSVTSIGKSAFSGCNSLASIGIPFVGATKKGDSKTHFGYIFGADSYSKNSSYVPSTLKTVVVTGGESIDSYAFYNCSSLTSIEIPDSVTSIGYNAFRYCSSLTSVEIPDSVTSIGSYAFYGCNSLINITIPFVGTTKSGNSNTHFGYIFGADSYSKNSSYVPSTLKTVVITGGESIDSYAFSGCKSLTSIEIPDSVTSIGYRAFYYCSSLTSINIPDSVTSIGSYAFYGTGYYNNSSNWENDVLYIGNHLIDAKDTISGSYIIKDGTKKIAEDAFYECRSLTSIEIPDSVTSIGSGAFRYCNSLTSIEIPDSVTSIGRYAFYGCSNLKNVNITDIDAWAQIDFEGEFANPIYYAKKLYLYNFLVEDVVLSENVTKIGSYAFCNCTSITSIEIPDSVKSIGEFAFYYCSNLNNVSISNSIEKINTGTFSNCTNLSSIELPNSLTEIGEKAFWKCSKLDFVEIPDGVTTIGNYAFNGCTGLNTVTVPNSVTSIGDNTFNGCNNLTIKCHNDSYARQYAAENSINCYFYELVPEKLVCAKKPTKIAYELNEEFDPTGAILKVRYTNGTQRDLSFDEVTIVGFDTSTSGANKVYFSYTENGETVNSYVFTLLVDRQVRQIFIPHKPNKTHYIMGEPFEREGMQIIASYTDGTSADVTAEVRTSGFDSTTFGLKKMTVSYTYKGKTVTLQFSYEMNPKLVGLELTHKPNKLGTYKVGEPLSKEGMIITAKFSDGSTKDVTHLIRTSGYSSKQVGKQIITVSYTYGTQTKSVQFSIIMKE